MRCDASASLRVESSQTMTSTMQHSSSPSSPQASPSPSSNSENFEDDISSDLYDIDSSESNKSRSSISDINHIQLKNTLHEAWSDPRIREEMSNERIGRIIAEDDSSNSTVNDAMDALYEAFENIIAQTRSEAQTSKEHLFECIVFLKEIVRRCEIPSEETFDQLLTKNPTKSVERSTDTLLERFRVSSRAFIEAVNKEEDDTSASDNSNMSKLMKEIETINGEMSTLLENMSEFLAHNDWGLDTSVILKTCLMSTPKSVINTLNYTAHSIERLADKQKYLDDSIEQYFRSQQRLQVARIRFSELERNDTNFSYSIRNIVVHTTQHLMVVSDFVNVSAGLSTELEGLRSGLYSSRLKNGAILSESTSEIDDDSCVNEECIDNEIQDMSESFTETDSNSRSSDGDSILYSDENEVFSNPFFMAKLNWLIQILIVTYTNLDMYLKLVDF
ncbi:hypothetical protein ABKN59_004575 [Abortiporus biennis]